MHSLAIDTLHCVHLGVFQRFCAGFLWLCIEKNAFAVAAASLEDRRNATVLIIREDLTRFYQHFLAVKGKQLTQISELTPKMLGKRRAQKLKFKETETWGFLLWVQNVQSRIAGCLGEAVPTVKLATDSLVAWMDTINEAGRLVSDSAQAKLCDCVRQHMAALRELEFAVIPKHHLWVHLTVGVRKLGNPRFYWTFLDESLNGNIKKIARRCHQATFERRVLGKAWKLIGTARGGEPKRSRHRK